MAVLTVKEVVGAGVSAGLVSAAAAGDSFPCSTDQSTMFHVKNASGSAVTVSVLPQTITAKVEGGYPQTLANGGGSVPATTGDVYFGPFPRAYIGANGQVQVTYSAVTSVTVEVLHMSKV